MARLDIVEENPYPNRFLNHLDRLAVLSMKICKVPMDTTISCLYMTTPEKEQWYLYIHRFVITFPLGLLVMVLFMPMTILTFGLWIAIKDKRKPYRLSYCGKTRVSSRQLRLKMTYSFLTTNVCLMPECMSRFNNFSRSWNRSQRIGEILVRKHLPNHFDSTDSSSFVIDMNGNDPNHNNVKKINPSNNSATHVDMPEIHSMSPQNSIFQELSLRDQPKSPDFDVSVLDYMPDTDFIFLQEASWDMRFSQTLVRELHNVYPYVVYDIGVHSFSGNLYVGNSGLMFASKYDILDIRFGVYLASCSPCWYASKGLLQVKVYLGRSPAGLDVVGYLFNTHLQAYKDNSSERPIQSEQLDDVKKWTKEFREQTLKEDEIVAFDVIGGDFNLDNMSPADEETRKHELFASYIDIGRERDGKDHYWTKGTELRQMLLYDPHVASPASLKTVLEDPVLMQTYLIDGNVTSTTLKLASALATRDENGEVKLSPVGGKRRVDMLLTNQRDSHLRVTQFSPVTALYSLTDHIPYYLAANISEHPELSEAFRE